MFFNLKWYPACARMWMTEKDRARIQTCTDSATLDHRVENVPGAKTITDVPS